MTVGQVGWNITNLFFCILLQCDKQYPRIRKYILQVRRILCQQRRTAEKSQAHPHLFMCDFFCHMFCTKYWSKYLWACFLQQWSENEYFSLVWGNANNLVEGQDCFDRVLVVPRQILGAIPRRPRGKGSAVLSDRRCPRRCSVRPVQLATTVQGS